MRISDWSSDVCSSDLIWGRYSTIPAGTKQAILAAMGVAAETEAEQAASLAALESRPWRDLVEPVVVVAAEAQPAQVPVTVPEGAGSTLPWRLDRKSVVSGKSVSVRVALGGRRIIKK